MDNEKEYIKSELILTLTSGLPVLRARDLEYRKK